MTASADGFDDATATSVSVVAGTITTQDFDLVRPVVDASPTSFETTVPLSSSADETLTLVNIGYVPPLDWSIAELPPTTRPRGSGNSGISAVVAPDGRMVGRLEEGERGLLLECTPREMHVTWVEEGWRVATNHFLTAAARRWTDAEPGKGSRGIQSDEPQ